MQHRTSDTEETHYTKEKRKTQKDNVNKEYLYINMTK